MQGILLEERDRGFIEELLRNGGPAESDDRRLIELMTKVSRSVKGDPRRHERLEAVWDLFGDALSLKTTMGFAMRKPYGYAGDFKIIDRIYTHYMPRDPALRAWDAFFHRQPGTEAVRNRRAVFHGLLENLAGNGGRRTSEVLNVGSGPGRDLAEFFSARPGLRGVHVTAVDRESRAIRYAGRLLAGHEEKVTLVHANIFRFRSEIRYDLVWSAGLFDYLDDRAFVFLLRRLFAMVRPGGRLVVGNYSSGNPSREIMEFGDWYLVHRSEKELLDLAGSAGLDLAAAHVESEPLGVNLFLHIEKARRPAAGKEKSRWRSRPSRAS